MWGGTGNSSSSSTVPKPATIVDGSGAEENTEDTDTSESHIYDNAEVVDLMNGTGTEKIGTITVVKVNQADCTEGALYDWYVNYVKTNSDSNYHVIIYNDVANKGVYSNGFGFIQKDITITPDNGSYMIGDDAGSTYYTVDESTQSLIAGFSMADESIVNEVKEIIDAIIPAEYKNSKYYAIDVGGEEGSLDCNLTLISEEFIGGDCQSIAEDLATQVKERNVGIGYFCIAFQSDDFTITAISSIDDLNNQEASEISTQPF